MEYRKFNDPVFKESVLFRKSHFNVKGDDMFVGHFGLGMAAKKSATAVSLGTLLLAAQFVDLLWPTFLLLGWEHVAIEPGITTVTPLNFTHYPISHSLLASIGWGFLLGAIYYAIKKNIKAALIIGALVVSHWFLDLIVHRPDLPLIPGGETLVGFGLWNSIAGTIVAESLLFFGGLYLYLRSTSPQDAIGRYGMAVMVGLLIFVFVSNLILPLPESVSAIAWIGHLQWLFVGLGYWVDKHRKSTNGSRQPIK